MIPSTPRRTWLFLGATCLLYFGPDLLLPAAWRQATVYPLLSSLYQGVLVLLGFAFGPAICRALVVREIDSGPTRAAVDRALAPLRGNTRPPPVVLAEHNAPFVLTAGLLPNRCQVFVSSALAERLSTNGLRFLLARASAHAALPQRLAGLLPLLVFTVLVPDDPKGLATWLALGGLLLIWLLSHWLFELAADRQAARLMGVGAGEGLREVLIASASPLDKLTPRPPLRWRLRAVGERMHVFPE